MLHEHQIEVNLTQILYRGRKKVGTIMTEVVAKRGRGRPPKVDSEGKKVVVVKVVSDRKRGRPPTKNADGSIASTKAIKIKQ